MLQKVRAPNYIFLASLDGSPSIKAVGEDPLSGTVELSLYLRSELHKISAYTWNVQRHRRLQW